MHDAKGLFGCWSREQKKKKNVNNIVNDHYSSWNVMIVVAIIGLLINITIEYFVW